MGAGGERHGAIAAADETSMIVALARKLSECKTRSPCDLPGSGLSNPDRVTIFPESYRLPYTERTLNDRDPRL
jgi:hypothetical protein